ncbi:transketolase family protein [candidate division WWE3 bacterium]|uniref:Transketolase family protein n=1 Tax=candidate division WWE3 bacterium TaxID=2053526 RepID=A0A3A4ZD13_UNCKA|nr:MAG: transketolase family protein [candidate division WWE3 bacterium]
MLNSKLKLNKELFQKSAEKRSTREGFGLGLLEAGEKDENIVVLCGDLKESTKVDLFAHKFPDRYIEIGVAEQNMTGIAAGLALSGKIPFMASFAIFSPGRNWEQIRLSISFSNTNVKIIGTHAGLMHCYDGGMAQCLEDIALTRVLPNFSVIEPIDFHQAKAAAKYAAKHKGPIYMRLGREGTPEITTESTPFEFGKAQVLVEGDEITLISSGPIMYEVLSAAKILRAAHKVNVEVISSPTIKPLDEVTIVHSAKKTKRVVTIENHQVSGGLGGAVAELLSEKYPVPIRRIGMPDTFGESGHYSDLLDKFGLSAHHLVNKILSILKDNE